MYNFVFCFIKRPPTLYKPQAPTKLGSTHFRRAGDLRSLSPETKRSRNALCTPTTPRQDPAGVSLTLTQLHPWVAI